jgi:hypothetical protein
LTKQKIQGDRAEEIVFQLLQTKVWVLSIGTGFAVGETRFGAAKRSTPVGRGGERSDGATA